MLVVDEVASFSEVAETFFCEGMACFCFVGSIVFHIDSKFLGSMGKLALSTVGAVPFFCKIFAEGSFGFGAECW